MYLLILLLTELILFLIIASILQKLNIKKKCYFTGTPKVQMTNAMSHLQQMTDSGREVEEESTFDCNYNLENQPIEWEKSNAQEQYNFISELHR